jgi:hypothetical protein
MSGARWTMFAHDYGDQQFYNLGSRPWVELHGLRYPIVEVTVREVEADDPAATHWGWMGTGKSEPTMIWPNWPCYSMCFHYGVQAEEQSGRGRTVRLRVTPCTDR